MLASHTMLMTFVHSYPGLANLQASFGAKKVSLNEFGSQEGNRDTSSPECWAPLPLFLLFYYIYLAREYGTLLYRIVLYMIYIWSIYLLKYIIYSGYSTFMPSSSWVHGSKQCGAFNSMLCGSSLWRPLPMHTGRTLSWTALLSLFVTTSIYCSSFRAVMSDVVPSVYGALVVG